MKKEKIRNLPLLFKYTYIYIFKHVVSSLNYIIISFDIPRVCVCFFFFFFFFLFTLVLNFYDSGVEER